MGDYPSGYGLPLAESLPLVEVHPASEPATTEASPTPEPPSPASAPPAPPAPTPVEVPTGPTYLVGDKTFPVGILRYGTARNLRKIVLSAAKGAAEGEGLSALEDAIDEALPTMAVMILADKDPSVDESWVMGARISEAALRGIVFDQLRVEGFAVAPPPGHTEDKARALVRQLVTP